MKECDIVRDLLFGYNDDTLYPGSKEFVTEHLKNCDKCQNILDEIKKDKIEDEEEIKIDYLKKINKNGKKKNIIIGILVILAILAVFSSILIAIDYLQVISGIEIFLSENATDKNIEDIKNAILEIDEKAEIKYKSKAEAFKEMKQKSTEMEKILEGYEENNNYIFPASFVVKVGIDKINNINEDNLRDMEGVKSVSRFKGNMYDLFFGRIVIFFNKI